jgi:hypothetical protein
MSDILSRYKGNVDLPTALDCCITIEDGLALRKTSFNVSVATQVTKQEQVIGLSDGNQTQSRTVHSTLGRRSPGSLRSSNGYPLVSLKVQALRRRGLHDNTSNISSDTPRVGIATTTASGMMEKNTTSTTTLVAHLSHGADLPDAVVLRHADDVDGPDPRALLVGRVRVAAALAGLLRVRHGAVHQQVACVISAFQVLDNVPRRTRPVHLSRAAPALIALTHVPSLESVSPQLSEHESLSSTAFSAGPLSSQPASETTQGHTTLHDARIPAVMETCTCHRVVVVSGRHLPAAARLPRPRAPALFRRACGRFVGVACVVDVGAAGCAAVQHDRLHVRFPMKTVHQTQLRQVSTTLGQRV